MRAVRDLACACLIALWAGGSVAAGSPRLIPLSPHLAELACEAGACDLLVARVAYSDHPPHLTRLPVVGDAFRLDQEAILVMRPDLLLAWEGGNAPAAVAPLERLGLRVEWIRTARLSDIAAALRRIGALAGTSDVGERAARAFERRLAALVSRYAGRRVVRVFWQIGRSPLYTPGRASPLTEALEVCGARNVFDDLPAAAAPVSLEAVLSRAPEAIVFARQDGEAQIRADWQRLPAIPAVRDGHLIALDADAISRPVPRMLDGVEALCESLERVRRARSAAR